MYGAFCILEIGDIVENIGALVLVILTFIACALLVYKIRIAMIEYRKSVDRVQRILTVFLILLYLFLCFYFCISTANLLNS